MESTLQYTALTAIYLPVLCSALFDATFSQKNRSYNLETIKYDIIQVKVKKKGCC